MHQITHQLRNPGLALQQFSFIVAPVALGLVLVVGLHPLAETDPGRLTGEAGPSGRRFRVVRRG
ncbi:MAG TPA: hypothetical protein VE462_08510 [Propionibacteriaceae bacterium]|nr:hypothetical protein [Propionibacteriaceae bacterium]